MVASVAVCLHNHFGSHLLRLYDRADHAGTGIAREGHSPGLLELAWVKGDFWGWRLVSFWYVFVFLDAILTRRELEWTSICNSLRTCVRRAE